MKPYPHQEKSINEILQHLETQNRVLFCLATGGGKTAVFSFLSKQFIKKTGKKVLIVAHRDELITQTANTLRTIGVTVETVVASKKSLHHNAQTYVAMIQTLKKRLQKDDEFLKDVGLIIVDECHLLMHKEIFEYYPEAKILGVTATPTVLKKINFTKCARCGSIHETITKCCNIETFEYTRNFTLSEIYEDIIIGKDITGLIDDGKLIKELVYTTGSLDRSSLKIDAKTGDFDNQDEQIEKGIFDVVKNYKEIAFDKKTIIFNSSAKINLMVFDAFQEAGISNVKIFDSVNDSENRKKVLEWFKNTPNAILCNVSVFTTGFDEPSVECVIMNRATLSRALYLQCVGRGGRPCDSIYKPYFTLIDGGGNVEAFGKWSDEIDWIPIFYGTDSKPKPKKEALENVKQCPECGYIHAKNLLECPECGYTDYQKEKTILISGEIATLKDAIPLPDGIKIVAYCRKLGKDKNFAWQVLQSQILDLFYYHNVTEGTFINTVNNGKFEMSIRNIIKNPYAIIQGSDLDGGVMRTKAWIVNKIKTKLNIYYERNTRASDTTTSV
jgi:superfamily II DNA or RNA helicase/ribosomal protein S27AE